MMARLDERLGEQAAAPASAGLLVIDLYVPTHSWGLIHDAQVLGQTLGAVREGGAIEVRRVRVPPAVFEGREPMAFPAGLGRPGQVAIFIERVFDADWLDRYGHRALLVNPEWLEPPSAAAAAKWVDTFLHKSRAAVSGLAEAFPDQRHVYLGFTSIDPGVRVTDYTVFSHFRGRARNRMTGEILALWRANPDLPTLWLQARGQDVPATSEGWQRQGNLRHFSGWLAPQDYFHALARGGIHLCTSQIEGFGHYINEARAMAALVITLDAPPMNELITPETGILVPALPGGRLHYGDWVRASPEALGWAVRRALQLSPAERAAMGRRARQAYEAGRLAFRRRLAAWVEELGRQAGGRPA